MDEKEKILKFRKEFKPYLEILKNLAHDNHVKMNTIELLDGETILHRPVSKHFSIYCFPTELDYYTDEQKKENRLISFDTPLIPERIPPPFVLPEGKPIDLNLKKLLTAFFQKKKKKSEFAKQDGPILYVSLGSMFSQYTSLVQRLVDILSTMPEYRYIISKGPRGDQVKLPTNGRFIGENWIDQLVMMFVLTLIRFNSKILFFVSRAFCRLLTA